MNSSENKHTKKVFSNFISSVIFQITATIVGFVIPMFVMKQYGAEIFGFSTSVMAVVGGINLLEIGLGSGLMQALFKPLHTDDGFQVNALLSRTKSFYNKTGLVIFLSAIVIAFGYSLSNSKASSFMELFLLALTLLSGSVFEYIFIGRFRVLLTSDEKVGILINIQSGALLIASTLRIVLMMLGFGVVLMQLIATSVYALRAFIIMIYVKRKYPQVSYNTKKSEIKIESNSVIFHNISNLVVLNAPFLLLLLFTDLGTTSVFAVYAIVFNAISSILYATFSQASVASFGKVAINPDLKPLKESFSIFEFVFNIILFSAFVITSSLIIDFVKLYSAGITSVNFFIPFIPILFTIFGIIFAFRYTFITLVQATGHFKETRTSVIIEMVLMVAASAIGVFLFKIYGVFIGMILSAIFRAIHLLWYVNIRILKQSVFLSVKRLCINFAISVPILWFFNTNHLFQINGWVQLILFGAIQGVGIFVIYFIVNIVFEIKTLKTIFSFGKSLIKR